MAIQITEAYFGRAYLASLPAIVPNLATQAFTNRSVAATISRWIMSTGLSGLSASS